jgi:hypothetical protein
VGITAGSRSTGEKRLVTRQQQQQQQHDDDNDNNDDDDNNNCSFAALVYAFNSRK